MLLSRMNGHYSLFPLIRNAQLIKLAGAGKVNPMLNDSAIAA